MSLFYTLHPDSIPSISEVGGKGLALIQLTGEQLPVPAAVILPTSFFQPWLDEVQRADEWNRYINSSDASVVEKASASLQRRCTGLSYNTDQRQALRQALDEISRDSTLPVFAVRSSSPQEDLEEASFAGVYETKLGVPRESAEEAVRNVFAGAFSIRVLSYKRKQGFEPRKAGIAIILQQMVRSEVAGVAFSLNPQNNSFDEAVINANYGLGESVVSGIVTPDTLITDKLSGQIRERRVGNKQVSVRLRDNGGTYREQPRDRSELSLDDERVRQITRLVSRVEEYYHIPMDIEWAYEGHDLYLLQARPVTGYVPLPGEMVTAPGEQKRLYLDMTLKQGIQRALSVLGTDYFQRTLRHLGYIAFGRDLLSGVRNGITIIAGGRMYLNLSNALRIMNQQRLANRIRAIDTTSSAIISRLDVSGYVSPAYPYSLQNLITRLMLYSRRTIVHIIWAFYRPAGYKKYYRRQEKVFLQRLEQLKRQQLDIREFSDRASDLLLRYLIRVTLPFTYAAEIGRLRMQNLFRKDMEAARPFIEKLNFSLQDNVTIEMGLSLSQLAGYPDLQECASAEEFVRRLEQREFSPAFLTAWDRFMKRFGFRGPREIDLAAPRYAERPGQIFGQLKSMMQEGGVHHDARAVHEALRHEREQAYRQLFTIAGKKGRQTQRRFNRYYRLIVNFGGLREVHKYYLVRVNYLVRNRLKDIGHSFTDAGRLDNPDHVFDLRFDDIIEAQNNPSADVRAMREQRLNFYRKLDRVKSFPHVIDSRGRIFNPTERHPRKGELLGDPVSPGTARGPVKVLHDPDEKPVNPGDILVARATDPGWTPLFINAAGVILEVGGALQHGAYVAREYGKPCVTGIANATTLLRDGQIVELDGSSGIVRVSAG